MRIGRGKDEGRRDQKKEDRGGERGQVDKTNRSTKLTGRRWDSKASKIENRER